MQPQTLLGTAFSLVACATLAPLSPAQTPLTTVQVASGLSAPLFATQTPIPGDDRLFVLEQNQADVEIFIGGVKNAVPFIDLNTLTTVTTGGERGLLGLAFHPNYEQNGYVFVNFTGAGGATFIRRYTVSSDPNLIDVNSGIPVMNFNQPFSNHNGGNLAFGPDGYLYIGTGDGGSANDPGCRAQNINLLLGKMLRIDIDTLDATGNYSIPPDNPFVGNPNARPEIYHIGLRNPWRWSIDRLTGDFYIGDVGQDAQEEISFTPAGIGGLNYGWRVHEGNLCNGLGSCVATTPPCGDPAYTFPIQTYNQTSGNCSVTGGYVYRGCAIPDLQGTYFYADYCTARIWSFRYVGGVVTEFQERTAQLDPAGPLSIATVTSFGQGRDGELYIVDQGGGEVFQIVPNGVAAVDCPPLVADWGSLSVSDGGQQTLSLDAGASQAGAIYLVLGSASGTVPGLIVDGLNLPLNADVYLTLSLTTANLPPFLGTLGFLDGSGAGEAAIALPAGALGPGAVGLQLNHAFLTLSGGGTAAFTSNATSLTLHP
jgi:glucose/arabinose dehydrogenase